MKSHIRCVLAVLCLFGSFGSWADDALETGFRNPPPSARPWVYWFPLDGNLSREGITLDLEAMQRVGIGGVLYMETDQGAPTGPAAFAGPLWREMFKHINAEAARLGLQVNVNNDAGWCGSGGPWITPELSMQVLVWTHTNVVGPQRIETQLAQPRTVGDFYRDIAVFAFPTPPKPYTIPNLAGKSTATIQEIPSRSEFPNLGSDAIVPRDRIVALGEPHCKAGRVSWDVPPGAWTLLRLGHTTTGKDNHPAPLSGRGLECDKLSKEAAEAAFAGLMSKIIADSPGLIGQDKTVVSTHIDSWEVGSQNWTPKFREEFERLRGYDPFPLLPVLAGHVVDSLEVSERFLWDVRMTVSDLLVENYAGHFQELARRNGIRLSIEAYGEPADNLTYAGRADEPMAEFWAWAKFGAASTCTEMSSAAHVYGKRILGAEAFTATDAERWQWHPGLLKDLGDWAFCEGINRFVFHRYAMQPWTDARPGMSMGPWGLHYERTQTWWEQSKAWHEYLARCQFLLQQGLFVADLCFLAPEMAPQSFKSPVKSGYDRPGYNFDGCPPEVVLERMKVKDGRLVLPDGMSYRMLVLPQTETMTPGLLRKIKELVADGATVAGAPPRKSPSLSGFPACDDEVRALALELWGQGDAPRDLEPRSYGQGRIFWGGEFSPKPPAHPESESLLAPAKWIWFKEGNPASSAPPGRRFFRRAFDVEAGGLVSARLVMTADNAFECEVNGHAAGSGDNWARTYELDLKPWLEPGRNLLSVSVLNATTSASPAGLIGGLRLEYENNRVVDVLSDGQWLASDKEPQTPETDTSWSAALELGSLGMGPWGDVQAGTGTVDPIPDIEILCRLLERLGVPPDFQAQTTRGDQSLRFIHRRIGDTEVYFVANKNPYPEDALCSFRVSGRRPEFWWPDTGRVAAAPAYDESGGLTRVPIRFDAYESAFVVFREGADFEPDRVTAVTRNGVPILTTASSAPDRTRSSLSAPAGVPPVALTRTSGGAIAALVSEPGAYRFERARGSAWRAEVGSLPEPVAILGPWEVRFAANWGAPDRVVFDRLISWSDHPEPGVKCFSGTAVYSTTFAVPPELIASDHRLWLDLGRVAVIAEVTLNGKPLGILWKAPFTVEATGAVQPGDNVLEVKVVNLWINRQIGDEFLPEDSERNPNGTLKAWPQWIDEGRRSPTGRYTFTSWRLWKKNEPLAESGLLGPVRLRALKSVTEPRRI
ncbi:MAG TPA: glycosyl hydrolase [Verrucomicrobiota bacterium]|nr:glycosyl hydrolase [Verrucomicrobiota bacterium]